MRILLFRKILSRNKLVMPLLVLPFMLLSSCIRQGETAGEAITVSIMPQKFLLQTLVRDNVSIHVMIPPGASPASYDPSPRQLKELEKSSLYFAVGHIGFEKVWLGKFSGLYPHINFVNTAKSMDLIRASHTHDDHMHEGVDPHVWLSPQRVKQMVESMAAEINKKEELKSERLHENIDLLLNRIDSVDRDFAAFFSRYEDPKFLIFHPALTYFARDYGLEQIPLEFEGKEPSPAYMRKIIDRARKEGIRLIFIQKEFDSSNAQVLANELNTDLVIIDPLMENWFDLMTSLKIQFVNHLNL